MVRSGYKECPYCAEEIREKAIKCRYCQSMLDTSTPAEPVSSSVTDLFETPSQKDLPSKVVERIFEGSEALKEGERRKITIMFADLVSFTAMAENMDPESVKSILDECFEIMSHCIERYGGTVDKYMGDAVMALFGAPQAHEDDPERAIRAAWEMLEEVRQLGKENGIQLELSVGASTGEVVVGGLGAGSHVQYTAIGDTVNLAYRLESVAQSGQIVINDIAYHCVRDIFECQSLGPLQVKGKTKPVNAYLVSEIGAATTKDSRLYRMKLTPLVGRKEELAQLQRWVGKLRKNEEQIIHLIGEAGVGKSRLLLEVKKQIKPGKQGWLLARSLSYGKHFPYHPLIFCMQNLCEIEPTDSAEIVWQKIRQFIVHNFTDYRLKREILAHLFGLRPQQGSKLMEFPPRNDRNLYSRI